MIVRNIAGLRVGRVDLPSSSSLPPPPPPQPAPGRLTGRRGAVRGSPRRLSQSPFAKTNAMTRQSLAAETDHQTQD